MACRGVLFAITLDEVAALRAARSDAEVIKVVETIEERWDESQLVETDKAWHAIHRVLSEDSPKPTGNAGVAAKAILGGQQLHRGDDYIVS